MSRCVPMGKGSAARICASFAQLGFNGCAAGYGIGRNLRFRDQLTGGLTHFADGLEERTPYAAAPDVLASRRLHELTGRGSLLERPFHRCDLRSPREILGTQAVLQFLPVSAAEC